MNWPRAQPNDLGAPPAAIARYAACAEMVALRLKLCRKCHGMNVASIACDANIRAAPVAITDFPDDEGKRASLLPRTA